MNFRLGNTIKFERLKNMKNKIIATIDNIKERKTNRALLKQIKAKTKHLEQLLSDPLPITIECNVLDDHLIIRYFEKEHKLSTNGDYIRHSINKQITPEKLTYVLSELDEQIANHQLINNKLKVIKQLPRTRKNLFNFNYLKILNKDNHLEIDYIDKFIVWNQAPFTFDLHSNITFTGNNTVNMDFYFIVSHPRETERTETLNGIEFTIVPDICCNNPMRREKFTCQVNDIRIEDVYETFKKIISTVSDNSKLMASAWSLKKPKLEDE